MLFGIVEGEPGIFPDPVSRLLRLLARPFRNRASKGDDTDSPGDDNNVEQAPRDGEHA